MIPLAVIGSAMIGIILLLFANRKLAENPYILIVNCRDEKAEQAALAWIHQSVSRLMIKAKTVNSAGIELTSEIRIRSEALDFVNRIEEIEGVSSAALVSYNGEYMG